ncbi:putative membrane protein, partial [Acinetobacter baumannii 24975_5]
IPEVKEDSDDLVMYTRVSLLIFFVLIEFGFLLAALF